MLIRHHGHSHSSTSILMSNISNSSLRGLPDSDPGNVDFDDNITAWNWDYEVYHEVTTFK